jgi:hypothetical protein
MTSQDPPLGPNKNQELEDFLAAYLCRAQRNQADLLQALGGIFEGLSLYIGPSGWGPPVSCSNLISHRRSGD